MTLEDFGFTVGYVTVGIFLGFIYGFTRGQIAGRRTGKVEGWIYAYRELVERIKAQGKFEKHSFIRSKQTKLLVVESNDDARQMLMAVLKMCGYEVCEASTASEGIDAVAVEKFDCAIVDNNLTDLTGCPAFRKMRSSSCNHGIRLIALVRGEKIDCADVSLQKPYQLDKLIEAIHD